MKLINLSKLHINRAFFSEIFGSLFIVSSQISQRNLGRGLNIPFKTLSFMDLKKDLSGFCVDLMQE